MAGLWDASTAADGSVVESCAVITVPAIAVMNVIDGTVGTDDGRMPAILTVEAQEAWLHGSAEEAFACLTPYSDELTALPMRPARCAAGSIARRTMMRSWWRKS